MTADRGDAAAERLKHLGEASDRLMAETDLAFQQALVGASFAAIQVGARSGFFGAYREHLLQRRADLLGKPKADLVPWVDYSPISIDDEAHAWSRGGRVVWGD